MAMRGAAKAVLCAAVLAGSGCVVDQHWRFDVREELTVRIRWDGEAVEGTARAGCAVVSDVGVEVPQGLALQWYPVPGVKGGICEAMDDVRCGCEVVLGPVPLERLVTVVDEVAALVPGRLARLVVPGVEVRSGAGLESRVYVVSGGRLGAGDPVAMRLGEATLRWSVEGAGVANRVRSPARVLGGDRLAYVDTVGGWLAGDPRRWVLVPRGE